jgi:hypothetical protein
MQRSPTKPLELRTWIELAHASGLVATIDDFAALPVNQPVVVIPLEHSKFLLHEYPDLYPSPVRNVPYEPATFFEPLRNTFTRSSDLLEVFLHYRDERGCVVRGKKPQVLGRLVFADGLACGSASIHSTREDRQAESGSGDGYARYIIWSRLADAKMPPVYNSPEWY